MGELNTAKLLVQCLENEGVKYVFGIPGEENLDVMDALLDSSIRFITVRHEQGAAHALCGDEYTIGRTSDSSPHASLQASIVAFAPPRRKRSVATVLTLNVCWIRSRISSRRSGSRRFPGSTVR